MRTFIFNASYNGVTIQVIATNERCAHYEAKKVFTDAHWSELSIRKVK